MEKWKKFYMWTKIQAMYFNASTKYNNMSFRLEIMNLQSEFIVVLAYNLFCLSSILLVTGQQNNVYTRTLNLLRNLTFVLQASCIMQYYSLKHETVSIIALSMGTKQQNCGCFVTNPAVSCLTCLRKQSLLIVLANSQKCL